MGLVIIDLTPVRDQTGPARLLDMVEGRSKRAFQDWLAQRPHQWRDQVEVVAMDGFSGFKTASTEELPDAVAVMDPFHVVRLAGTALDECRRRVPPAAVNAFLSSSTSDSPVIERSTMFSMERRVCSSTVEAILMALPSTVESNWKSIAHTTFGASASIGGAEEIPARLRGDVTFTCRPSSRHSRWIFEPCVLLTQLLELLGGIDVHTAVGAPPVVQRRRRHLQLDSDLFARPALSGQLIRRSLRTMSSAEFRFRPAMCFIVAVTGRRASP